MELPVKMPVSGRRRASYLLQAKELFYEIRSRGGDGDTKHVLKKVCCEARPGEILAIVGPSGAGKTTLLEILAGMIPLSRVSGEILVNGGPIDVGKFRRLSGYVTQDDALFPLLTVEETLMYSARLRLRGGTQQALTRVGELLKELGLDHISGSRVGGNDNTYGGISGGERRRVSIGVDVVHDPAVMFLDEPTSGLDSASALQVVSLLKSMAVNQGKTIITTIHQPGFRILELFNGIVLLSEGTVVHHGSLQSLESRLKLAGHCIPRHVNVLEFAIDVMQGLGIKTQIVDHGFFVDYNSDGKDHESNGKQQQQQQEAIIYSSSIKEMPFSYANSPYEEILILSRRISSNIFRTKQLFATRSIQSLVVGFMLGTIFMNVYGKDTTAALQTQAGFFAFSLTFLLSSTTEGLPIYLQERRILMREISRGAYRVSSYVIANTLVFIPFLLMVALLYTTPVYWLAGLRRELDGYLYYSLVAWMVILMANSFVACFSALVPNFIMGNSLIAGFMGSFFLFSGYFIPKRSIPKYWIFMHYLSLFKYPFEAFMINEYGGKKGKRCIQSQMGQCFLDGKGFLMQQELKESQKWSNLGVMLGFICGFRVLCFLILWYRCHRIRI